MSTRVLVSAVLALVLLFALVLIGCLKKHREVGGCEATDFEKEQLAQLYRIENQVLALLEGTQDVVKCNCIRDKHYQIKELRKEANWRVGACLPVRLSKFIKKAEKLQKEAEACIGVDL
jgi:hypothetical protein